MTQRYGDVWSEKSSKTHTGVDIAASKGTAVPSMSNGRVAAIVDLGGRWGKAVVIEEPSGKARGYLHIDPTVRRGDTVVAGDKLGTVTRDHLHYNVCREVALCHRGALPTSKPDPEYPGDPLFPGPFLKP